MFANSTEWFLLIKTLFMHLIHVGVPHVAHIANEQRIKKKMAWLDVQSNGWNVHNYDNVMTLAQHHNAQPSEEASVMEEG